MSESNNQKAQQWKTADADIRVLVNNLIESFKKILGKDLVGIYLHGSLAMGSYYRPKSDIDLLVVVNKKLSNSTRKALAEKCADLSDQRQRTTIGDLELSVLQKKYAKKAIHPTPYEVHFGSNWKQRIRKGKVDYSKDTDADLAAHLMVTKKRGIRLCGVPISNVFGSVPWQYYLDAVMHDFRWIIAKENMLTSPIYAVLNSCRVMQLSGSNKKTVASKEEGALWAIDNLPSKYVPIIRKALRAYQSPDAVSPKQRRTAGPQWNRKALLDFRDFVKQKNDPRNYTK